MIRVYNKAIRDKIPEIIEASGSIPTIEKLSDEDFLTELENKLDEEIKEYKESKKIEELCDLIEIAMRIAELKGMSNDSLEQIRKDKNLERGKFEENLFLIQVTEQNNL